MFKKLVCRYSILPGVCVFVCVCGGGYSNLKFVYMCRGGGDLGSGPSLKMEGGARVSERSLTGSRKKQGILELQITKKRIFFLKRGAFRSAQVGKAE